MCDGYWEATLGIALWVRDWHVWRCERGFNKMAFWVLGAEMGGTSPLAVVKCSEAGDRSVFIE